MIQFRNPIFAADGSTIKCEIYQNDMWLKLTLDPNIANLSDAYVELYAAMAPEAAPYVAPAPDHATEARVWRDGLLATNVDKAVPNIMCWNEMSPAEQAALSAYRQALLDVPQQAGFPENIDWPVLGE